MTFARLFKPKTLRGDDEPLFVVDARNKYLWVFGFGFDSRIVKCVVWKGFSTFVDLNRQFNTFVGQTSLSQVLSRIFRFINFGNERRARREYPWQTGRKICVHHSVICTCSCLIPASN
jgi:hypothetical protein